MLEIVHSIKNDSKIDLIEKAEILYNEKDEIIELLNCLNIILFKQQIWEPIILVEKTKRKILYNNNYEMSIDSMLIQAWNAVHNITRKDIK